MEATGARSVHLAAREHVSAFKRKVIGIAVCEVDLILHAKVVDHFLGGRVGKRTVLVFAARTIDHALFDLGAIFSDSSTHITAIGHARDGEVPWVFAIDLEGVNQRFIG